MNTFFSIFLDLVINDFRSRYLNNVLGAVWAFVQPAVTVLIFWMVFAYGLKATPVGDVPFSLWIIAGMVPWFFLSESISAASNAIIAQDYLVKKIAFDVEMLPVVKITSAVLVHLLFVILMMAIAMMYGYTPQLGWLQLLYYVVASLPFLLGIGWIFSSIIVFVRDLGHIISMGVQLFFWLTPIVWPLSAVPLEYRFWLLLNPFYTIVEGYRGALFGSSWFWDNPVQMVFFWGMSLGTMVFGLWVFRKLRPHFADVL